MDDLKSRLNQLVQEKVTAKQQLEDEKRKLNQENYMMYLAAVQAALDLDDAITQLVDEVNTSNISKLGYSLEKESNIKGYREAAKRYRGAMENPNIVLPKNVTVPITLYLNPPGQPSRGQLPANSPQRSNQPFLKIVFYSASNTVRLQVQPSGVFRDVPLPQFVKEVEEELVKFIASIIN